MATYSKTSKTTPCAVDGASEIKGLLDVVGALISTRRIFAGPATRILDLGSGCVSFGRDDFDLVAVLEGKSVDQLLGKNHGKIVIPFENLHRHLLKTIGLLAVILLRSKQKR